MVLKYGLSKKQQKEHEEKKRTNTQRIEKGNYFMQTITYNPGVNMFGHIQGMANSGTSNHLTKATQGQKKELRERGLEDDLWNDRDR